MSLIAIVLVLALAGFACWLILQIPMPEPFPRIIIGVICLFIIMWLLQSFGLIGTHVRLQ